MGFRHCLEFIRPALAGCAVWLVCSLAVTAMAQTSVSTADANATADTNAATDASADFPTRVARVAWLVGDVGLMSQGQDQWHEIRVNRPLTDGDRLSTSADARVELAFDHASLRLAGDTDFGLLELGQWQARGALTRGSVQLSVRSLPDGQAYEIDTPQVAVVVDRPARVRVDLGDGEATTLVVYQGSAVVYGDDGARRVIESGQRYRFADSSLATAESLGAIGDDAFGSWCRSRDALYADSDSAEYVSEGTIGYEDLDRYGAWETESDYGSVWFPGNVATSWAPYRNGRWDWIAPWGWTWVSNAPWGFAPFHYGRWQQFSGRWGWIPGPTGVRAVYAPAMVAFVGGSNWRVSIGIGARPVGWYPLGPGMVYNPWFSASRHYYVYVNRRNMRHRGRHGHRGHRGHHRHGDADRRIDQAYNAWRKPKRVGRINFGKHPPKGITAVSRHTFAGGGDVGKARLNGLARRAGKMSMRPHGPGVDPSPRRHDLLQANVVRRLPVHNTQRGVVSRYPGPANRSRGASHAVGKVHGSRRASVRVLRPAKTARERLRRHQPLSSAESKSRHTAAGSGANKTVSRPRHASNQTHRDTSSATTRLKPKGATSRTRHLPVVPRLRQSADLPRTRTRMSTARGARERVRAARTHRAVTPRRPSTPRARSYVSPRATPHVSRSKPVRRAPVSVRTRSRSTSPAVTRPSPPQRSSQRYSRPASKSIPPVRTQSKSKPRRTVHRVVPRKDHSGD